jgi:YVTN family beta-propeller protein
MVFGIGLNAICRAKLRTPAHVGGKNAARPELDACLKSVRQGEFLYDPSGSAGSNAVVYMIDTNTSLVTGNPIAVGNQPWQIAISSNARRAYVTNYADGTASVINISL